MLVRHASERMALHAAQKQESRKVLYRIKTAVLNLIECTPGLRSVLSPITKNPNLNDAAEFAEGADRAGDDDDCAMETQGR